MTRNKFDMQLDRLNEQLKQMGVLCESAIANATEALKAGSREMAKEVIAADEEIDQMEKDIERLCLKLLLQQQPVAKDLRVISAALKMITDMERIGDQTADIAEIIISAGMNESKDVQEIPEMSAMVSAMVHNSVQAFVTKDLELTQEVIHADDAVDEKFESVREDLIKFISEAKENQGSEIVDLIMVAKYLERIGDHATNIAEWVEFSITGVHKDQNSDVNA